MAQDDQRLYAIRRDFSGGVNTRQHASKIGENQAEQLDNWDIGIPGQTQKRPGFSLIGNDVGDNSVLCLHNYEIQGATDQLLMFEGTMLRKWTGSGNWVTVKGDFSASTDVGIISAKMSGISPDDVVIVQNDIDNAFLIESDGTALNLGSGATSPPKSTVMCWYGNRIWILDNDLLYYSDAYDSDYSTAFVVTNSFRIPVGQERKLLATRDMGIIVMGDQAIWGLAPSATPAATDKPEPLITNLGCVSKKGAVIVGDDIYFFAQDGLRALKRTVQDKLQLGITFPISYRLKTEFEAINWAYISNLSMEYFDNKVFVAVPTSTSTWDLWIYYPASDSFKIVKSWTPFSWAKYKVSGEERLYFGKYGDGSVYRAWTGYDDNGTAISATFIGREEDFGQPLNYKVGGELEIEAEVAGSGNSLTVSVSLDGANFQALGTVNLTSSTAPVLPISLPFSLSDSYIVRDKFHLDSLGRFRTIQIKIENSDLNTETITFYAYNIVTYLEEYEGE